MLNYKWNIPNTALFNTQKGIALFKNVTQKRLTNMTSVVKTNVKFSAPVGATTRLRNTVNEEVKGNTGFVFTGVNYAPVIEAGRRAKPVSRAADPSLIRWLRKTRKGRRMLLIARQMMMRYRKSKPSTAQVIKSALFVLKRSMKLRKRKPNPFFKRGVRRSDKRLKFEAAALLRDLAMGLAK